LWNGFETRVERGGALFVIGLWGRGEILTFVASQQSLATMACEG